MRVALVRGSREPGQALTGAALSGVPLFEGLSCPVELAVLRGAIHPQSKPPTVWQGEKKTLRVWHKSLKVTEKGDGGWCTGTGLTGDAGRVIHPMRGIFVSRYLST